MPQLFAPVHSTETRLMVRAPLRLKEYDIVEYEQMLNAFNLDIRRTAHPSDPPLDLWLPGHDRGFESARLYWIAETYVKERLPHRASSANPQPRQLDARAARLIFLAEQRLAGLSNRTIASCVPHTVDEYSDDIDRKIMQRPSEAAVHEAAKRKLRMWRSVVAAQHTQNLKVSIQRMHANAVRAGVLTREEARSWENTLRSCPVAWHGCHGVFKENHSRRI